MRGVGRGKIFPIFSSGKDEGCGKVESIPHLYSSKEGLGMWEGGKYSPFFSIGKDEGRGKGENIPHFFHQ